MSEVTYNREDFIRYSDVKKAIATKYCDEHPKDRYGYEDFQEVFRLANKSVINTRDSDQPLGWDESEFFYDRVIDIFTEDNV